MPGPWFLRCDAAMRCSFALVTAARRVISGTTCASHSASNTATVTSTDTATARSLESPRLRRRRIHHLAGGPFLVLLPYFLSRPTSLVRCSLLLLLLLLLRFVVASPAHALTRRGCVYVYVCVCVCVRVRAGSRLLERTMARPCDRSRGEEEERRGEEEGARTRHLQPGNRPRSNP